jgi:hypothetical protein
MKLPIPIYLAVEDELSEWVARRALATQSPRFAVGPVFRRGGYGYLKKQAAAFNNAAKGCPFLLLTDLDQYTCPPELIAEWLTVPKHRHLLLRVAVREVESWLLGDAAGLGSFLGLRVPIAAPNPERLADPKRELLQAAMRCPRRIMRDALVWRDKQSGQLSQGPDYNGALAPFVSDLWDIAAARRQCPSLEALFAALARLEAEYSRGRRCN